MAESTTAGAPLIPVEFDPFASRRPPSAAPDRAAARDVACGPDGGRGVLRLQPVLLLHLRGPLSAESLQNALRQVIARHEALRVAIDADGERQTIAASSQIELPVVDLIAPASRRARAAEIEHLLESGTRRPFDLAAGPLMRATLIREAPDLHRLVLTVHHIVCDGWSSAVLFGDLAALRGGPPRLPARLPAAVSYRDHVAREAARAQDPQVRADEDYWAQQYADSVPVLELPLERPRPGVKTYRGARQELRLDESLCRALKAAGAKPVARLFMTLLAAFEVLLSAAERPVRPRGRRADGGPGSARRRPSRWALCQRDPVALPRGPGGALRRSPEERATRLSRGAIAPAAHVRQPAAEAEDRVGPSRARRWSQ